MQLHITNLLLLTANYATCHLLIRIVLLIVTVLLLGTGETYTNLTVKCQRYTNYVYVSISTKVVQVLAILSRVKMLLPKSRLGNIYKHLYKVRSRT